ncbi:hypothetical protein D3C80_1292320 [compost metagenome]
MVERRDGLRRQSAVGTGDNHDSILAIGIDHDQRDTAGRPFDTGHPLTVDTLMLQGATQLLAIGIGAHAADHRHPAPQSRSGNGLVGTLASGNRGKRMTDQCFPGARQTLGTRHQVHVQAANDYHIRGRRMRLARFSGSH